MDNYKVIRKGANKITTSTFSNLCEGDTVFSHGEPIILECNAHYSGDADYDGYLFYDKDDESFFPEDIDEE